mmetsp:Transcript_9484/g.14285  ORF Transcript_9484/g.14285 Transcript_9484/m.14285 type:complete len:127 (-) Transcript_9484:181-561(-)
MSLSNESIIKPSRPHSFKVAIPVTPQWKIDAIARYKAKQNLKKRGHGAIVGRPCNELFPKADKKLKIDAVNQGCVVSSPLLYELKRILNLISQDITVEIKNLNNARCLLIWLLKKSTLYETNLNHA